MHKLIYLLIPLALGFFSCGRKSIYMTNKELKETLERVDGIITDSRSSVIDTQSLYYNGNIISIDTSLDYTVHNSFDKIDKIDTTQFILKHVSNWEEGTIETITGRAFIPYRISFDGTYQYDDWKAVLQKSTGKLPDGTIIYCPLEVEGLDLVEFYFKRKQ